MLQVPQQEYIRFLREVDGCSIQEIADRTQVNWRTAKKYADCDDWNEPIRPARGHYPVLGDFIEIIDTWLLEDEQLPRKQRQTGTRIFHRLAEEHAYTGSSRTILAYIQKRKEELKIERTRRYERLEHQEGEAQADFGTHQVVRDGMFIERKVLTLSFPYSNAAFVFPVPSENTECFLEALKQCFEKAGGVPRCIWFDNLSAAVVSIGKDGNRTLTEAFTRFVAHYRFEPIFCNPASGNEKGNVENKVGYGRRNWCSPPPAMPTDEEFEQFLANAARKDMERVHYQKNQPILKLWEHENKRLLSLPTVAYEVSRQETRKLNKYAELEYEGIVHLIPQCKAEQLVLLNIRFKDMDVMDSSKRIVATLPRAYTSKTTEIDWQTVVSDWIKRPRAVSHSAFASMLPNLMRLFLRDTEIAIRKIRLSLVARLLETYSLIEMEQALGDITDGGNTEITLEHRLYARRHPILVPEPFAEPHTPISVVGHETDLSMYDDVLRVSAI